MSLLIEIQSNSKRVGGYFPDVRTTREAYSMIKNIVYRMDDIKREYCGDVFLQSIKLLQCVGCILSRDYYNSHLKGKYASRLLYGSAMTLKYGSKMILDTVDLTKLRAVMEQKKEMIIHIDMVKRQIQFKNCFKVFHNGDAVQPHFSNKHSVETPTQLNFRDIPYLEESINFGSIKIGNYVYICR